jgi:hypothetical protein
MKKSGLKYSDAIQSLCTSSIPHNHVQNPFPCYEYFVTEIDEFKRHHDFAVYSP